MQGADPERLRRGYAAFNEGGIEAVIDWLAPDITVRDRESLPDRETHHGIAGILEVFESMMEAFDRVTLEPTAIVERSGRVVVSVRQCARGRGSGAEVESEVAHVWTLDRGRPVALRMFRDTEQALASVRDEQTPPAADRRRD